MKTIYTLLLKTCFSLFMVFVASDLRAQIPQKMNYQGALRDSKGSPMANQTINLRLGIQDAGPQGITHYSEEREVNTNALGLYHVAIGSEGAQKVIGNFSQINWATGNKFLKVEIDPDGGNNFTLAGLTQLISVPYALHAKYAENGPKGDPGPAGANGSVILSGTTDPLPGIGNPGDYYFNTTTHVLYGPQNPNGSWPDGTILLQGPAGADGLAGPAGPIGPEGLSAYEIWQGLPGNDGKTVAEFLDGITGPAGPTGLTGADGLSAYQVWEGLPGNDGKTVTEFLAGITGPAGPTGLTGADGLSAYQVWEGLPGNDGKTITEFLDGITGPQGVPGVDGAQGPIGLTGPTGNIGPAGANGFNCWDTNMNGVNDETEDINGDGLFNIVDCKGTSGISTLTNTHIFVGNSSSIPQDVAMSGDATITNTGAVTITNGAITLAKMANGTPDQIYTTNVAGVPTLQSFNGIGWSLRGNSGTVDGTHFLGTTDVQPLNFRVNNVKAGRVTDATLGETTLGFRAGFASAGTFRNTLIGLRAGENLALPSGRNTFIGAAAANMAGNNASRNTAIGELALGSLVTGDGNTSIGGNAGLGVASGSHNVFIGFGTTVNPNPLVGGPLNADYLLLMGDNARGLSGITNATALGANAQVTTSNSLVLGSVTTPTSVAVNVGIGTSAPVQKLHITDGRIFMEQTIKPAIGNNFIGNGLNTPTIVDNSADTRGKITFAGTTNNFGAGWTMLRVNYNLLSPLDPTQSLPVVTITPANQMAAQCEYFVMEDATGFTLSFRGRSTLITAPQFNYISLD